MCRRQPHMLNIQRNSWMLRNVKARPLEELFSSLELWEGSIARETSEKLILVWLNDLSNATKASSQIPLKVSSPDVKSSLSNSTMLHNERKQKHSWKFSFTVSWSGRVRARMPKQTGEEINQEEKSISPLIEMNSKRASLEWAPCRETTAEVDWWLKPLKWFSPSSNLSRINNERNEKSDRKFSPEMNFL